MFFKNKINDKELARRKALTQDLLNKHPLNWTDSDKERWLEAGYKLPRIIDEEYLTRTNLNNRFKPVKRYMKPRVRPLKGFDNND